GKAGLTAKAPGGRVDSRSDSPDGTRIVTGRAADREREAGDGGEVTVWDAQTGQVLHAFKGHSGPVWSAAFSPDGRRLVSGSGESQSGPGEVRVWTLQTTQAALAFAAHQGPITAASCSPNGPHVVSASGAPRPE